MPFAARVSDDHACPEVEPVPHVGGPILTGCPTVIVGFEPAARIGDAAACVGPPDTIVEGSPTVIVGGRPAARLGDSTEHGGVIVAGCPTVIVGETAQVRALRAAAALGVPFCAPCTKDALDAAGEAP